ncbi:MAG: hypothetical protein M3N39_04430 [Pseudomonadota bacterium]|nr:hypothetical protein [Pseudomonadota bacterium]
MATNSPSVGDFSVLATHRATASIARAPGLHMGEGPRVCATDMARILQPFAKGAA